MSYIELTPKSKYLFYYLIYTNIYIYKKYIHYNFFYRIVSVDVNPQWPEKKAVLTGSVDGSVKQWDLELINYNYKFKSTLSHDVHLSEKEVRILVKTIKFLIKLRQKIKNGTYDWINK